MQANGFRSLSPYQSAIANFRFYQEKLEEDPRQRQRTYLQTSQVKTA
ncbi:hypothetical protein BVRB_5g104870 [Beta vulgaris subsp. vulgaris]|nr:hypothetical protein BVRB_5g104870 [Beta vulgaris subsp. vulgaris]